MKDEPELRIVDDELWDTAKRQQEATSVKDRDAGAARAAKDAELAKVRRDHEKLVQAILDGVAASQLKDRMNALDAKRQQLEAELSDNAPVDPVRLHPSIAETYRTRVRELVAALTESDDTASALDAREAVRAPVTRIVLTPEVVPGRKLSEVRIDPEGALAGILHLATGARAAAAGVEFATMAAARMQGGESHSEANHATAPQNNEGDVPFGTAPVLQMQGTQVAGAGFGLWRTGWFQTSVSHP